jgi:urea transport system permease protein
MLAGIGGALYVPQAGIINPGEFAPANSIEAVIWVAFGGRGTLWGAIVGGVGVNAIKSWLTGSFPELWLYALGVLFIATTLFLPKGVAGLLSAIWAKRRAPTPSAPALAAREGVKG